MALCVDHYLDKGRKYQVLDLGSRISPGQDLTHRGLLADYDVDYLGVDITQGHNVDVLMEKPYRIPAKSGSMDVLFSGQTFEHIPFPWASFLEIARVLKPHGLAFLTAPSRGHLHSRYDCWRYYPDGLRSLAAWSGLQTVEAHTDFPPVVEGVNRPRPRYDYARLDTKHYYWGDSVGVFRKPTDYPTFAMTLVRLAVLWWANRIGAPPDEFIGASPPGRDDVLATRDAPRPAGARQPGEGPVDPS
jgi:SAM-dependent methyltransferase